MTTEKNTLDSVLELLNEIIEGKTAFSQNTSMTRTEAYDWCETLSDMSPEQIQRLELIISDEKRNLAFIDDKFDPLIEAEKTLNSK